METISEKKNVSLDEWKTKGRIRASVVEETRVNVGPAWHSMQLQRKKCRIGHAGRTRNAVHPACFLFCHLWV